MARECVLDIHDRQVAARWADDDSAACPHRELAALSSALPPAELFAALRACIAELGRVRRATLVIPSSWCAVHPLASPTRRPSAAVLGYALEEFLPDDIDRCVCEFLRLRSGDYLGCAIERARLEPLLTAALAAGLAIERVTLDVLHAAEHTHLTQPLVWCDVAHVAVCTPDAERIQRLRVIRLADALAVSTWVEHVCWQLTQDDELAAATRLHVAGCVDVAHRAALAAALGQQPVAPAASVRPRHALGQFDLLRGPLARSTHRPRTVQAWSATAAVLLLALLALSAGLTWRNHRLRAQLRASTAWEQQLFMQIFPGRPVPVGVALQLASERKRLQNLTLATPAATPAAPDALELLRRLAAATPADLVLQLEELRLEGGDLTLRGRTRDHQQAETLAAALGASGWACSPPRTERHRDGGVQFYLHAEPSSPPALSRKDPP